MEVFQGFEIATASEPRAAVVAERSQDAPGGPGDRAGGPLIGVLPGKIEIVEPAPAVTADESEAARMNRSVVVDQNRVLGRAGDVPREVRDAMADLVRTVAEVRRRH